MQKLTDAEFAALSNATSERAWNAICDGIKKARHGQYPPDWWERIMVSGLSARVQSSWK